jgi:hypothetical protein
LKVKKRDEVGKGGAFAVVAYADGKLTVQTITWDGPAAMGQCVVDAGQKTVLTPLQGPPVGVLWEFLPPGAQPQHQEPPQSLETRLQSQQQTAQLEVEACAQQNLPPDFPADVEVMFYVAADGKVYAPTLVKSTSKDGGFDGCVRKVVERMQLPAMDIRGAVPLTLRFHVGRSEKL